MELRADTKGQAFNFAYGFFETGLYASDTAWEAHKGLCRVIDFIPEAASLNHLRGKYKVFRSSVKVK